ERDAEPAEHYGGKAADEQRREARELLAQLGAEELEARAPERDHVGDDAARRVEQGGAHLRAIRTPSPMAIPTGMPGAASGCRRTWCSSSRPASSRRSRAVRSTSSVRARISSRFAPPWAAVAPSSSSAAATTARSSPISLSPAASMVVSLRFGCDHDALANGEHQCGTNYSVAAYCCSSLACVVQNGRGSTPCSTSSRMPVCTSQPPMTEATSALSPRRRCTIVRSTCLSRWASSYVTSVSPPFQAQVCASRCGGCRRVITPWKVRFCRSWYFFGSCFSEESREWSNSSSMRPPTRSSNSPAASHLARFSDSVM